MSLEFNQIFSDNAVFAHGKPIKVYGNGCGSIKVTLNGVEKCTECVDGKWSVTLPAMEVGGPYELTAEQSGEKVSVKDVYIGEVILLLGQSNAQFKLHETRDDPYTYVTEEKARLYTIDRLEAGEFFFEKDGWVKCEKEIAGKWTALGYYTATKICAERNIPVGVISCYQGASMIQAWLSPENAQKEDVYVKPEDRHSDYKDFPLWNKDGTLYTKMLSKVIPYTLSRVVYYQGESNTSEAEGDKYYEMLKTLIAQLREDFNDEEMPITVVQIADLLDRNDDAWKAVQRQQLKASQIPNVKTVISADVSENDDIHPKTKKPLADRIVQSFFGN